jgi:type IV pilus assembly protein PilY1
MKRAISMVISLLFFPLAFLPGDVSGATTPCSNQYLPPFIASGIKPNVLIILDNSNSMDEDFLGNAVGSYSPASKSVVARQALQKLVQDLQDTANVGIMTYTLPTGSNDSGGSSPTNVSSYYIYNSMPFTSYNPASYCPNPPPDCVAYCTTGNATSQSNCQASCQQQNSAFSTNFTDLILNPTTGPYPFNEPTGTRARYCGLAYPKITMMANPTSPGNNIYWNVPDPMYSSSSNLGTQFGYCGSDLTGYAHTYSPAEGAANTYAYFYTKTGASDAGTGYSSYSASYQFVPTDSDWALGFYNWGQRMPWYYVGPTWFNNDAVTSGPQGYLQVGVSALTNSTQYNNVYNILNPNLNNSAGYMSCTASNKNACSYIVNAGNTPAAGTLASALNYFNGNYTGFCFNSSGVSNGTACTKSSNCNSSYPNCSVPSPITSSCQQNFIIYVTDGLPDTMLNGSMPSTTTQYCYNSAGQTNNQTCTTTSNCPSSYNASCSTAVIGQVLNQLYNLQSTVSQKIGGTTYSFPVQTYILGIGSEATAGPNLNNMAVAGGTAVNGQAYYADNADALTAALNAIAVNLLQRVAAGSSISILSQGQAQNGDNMLQGVFYPSKYFGMTLTYWPGYLYDWWFYNGTSNNGVSYNNIREDTDHDYILELNKDDGIVFEFSQQSGLSVNRYSDPTGSGNPSQFVNNVGLDSLTPLWEAGKLLFEQTAASRVIYTPGSGASGLVSFNTSNPTLTSTTSSPLGLPANLTSCLQGSTNAVTMQNLINYVSGVDLPNCRNRTVGLCSNGTSFSNIPCATSSDCAGTGYGNCTQNVWKLGDIVYSTPKLQTSYYYCSIPNSSSFNSQACSSDSNCTTAPYTGAGSCQAKESVVFVGANDGMLHAFKTGILTTNGMNPANYQVETFTGIPDTSMGTELWAFIPQNALPYLRCLAVPPPSNCHLYYNDLSPYITTMVANGVSKTILIGGMRLGGGSVTGPAAKYCFNGSGVSNGQTCTNTSNCTSPYNVSCSSAYPTNVPADTCSGGVVTCSNPATCYGNVPQNPSSCTGLSSYYALDITDVENPKLLWEFSHPFLGYTYSGPAVIHKWTDPVHLTGDQYYVMFLSGPTGPSDGSSIQDVQAFVLSLSSSLGISSVYYNDLGPKNGFGGRLFTNGLSLNGDIYTDFVFFGYANAPNGATTSGAWQGGIGVVNTNNTDPTSVLNPQNWNWDVTTYDQIAQLPITSQIATGQCFNQTYLFAGTGRYFFPLDNYSSSANSGLNYLMAIPFVRYCSNGSSYNYQMPCTQNANCTTAPYTTCSTAVPATNSLNQNTTACSALKSAATTNDLAGAAWQYNLDPASADGTYLAERLVTDPTPPALISGVSNNIAYFVTSEPTSDPCSYGGQTRVWGLNCATGGAINDQSCNNYAVSNTTGTLYLQTSTGAIYKIDNSSSFTNAGGRATQWFPGMPPETQPPVVQPATAPAKGGQLIQWIER